MKKIKLYSDHDLVLRLKDGDQFAYEILFYKYKNKLKGFICSLIPPQIDPDEVLQQVFVKIWLQREKLDSKKSFSSFLFAIAKNIVIDQLRSSVSRKIYFMGDMWTDLDVADKSGADPFHEMEEKVGDLIAKLPERRRQIFELSRFEGLTYKQISERLSISENTVDTQIRKALSFLKDEIRRFHLFMLLVVLRVKK